MVFYGGIVAQRKQGFQSSFRGQPGRRRRKALLPGNGQRKGCGPSFGNHPGITRDRRLGPCGGRRAWALRCALTGDVGTGDGRWRLWCLRSFRAFCLAEDEGDEGPADLEPALGVRCPIPLRIPLLSVGGGLCPAPSGVAGYSDDRVGADLCVRPLSRPP